MIYVYCSHKLFWHLQVWWSRSPCQVPEVIPLIFGYHAGCLLALLIIVACEISSNQIIYEVFKLHKALCRPMHAAGLGILACNEL